MKISYSLWLYYSITENLFQYSDYLKFIKFFADFRLNLLIKIEKEEEVVAKIIFYI